MWTYVSNFVLWAWKSNYTPHKTVGIDSLVPGGVISEIPASGPQAQVLFLRYLFFRVQWLTKYRSFSCQVLPICHFHIYIYMFIARHQYLIFDPNLHIHIHTYRHTTSLVCRNSTESQPNHTGRNSGTDWVGWTSQIGTLTRRAMVAALSKCSILHLHRFLELLMTRHVDVANPWRRYKYEPANVVLNIFPWCSVYRFEVRYGLRLCNTRVNSIS